MEHQGRIDLKCAVLLEMEASQWSGLQRPAQSCPTLQNKQGIPMRSNGQQTKLHVTHQAQTRGVCALRTSWLFLCTNYTLKNLLEAAFPTQTPYFFKYILSELIR